MRFGWHSRKSEIEIENQNWKPRKCFASGEREGESAQRHRPLLPGSAACCTPSGCILANLPAKLRSLSSWESRCFITVVTIRRVILLFLTMYNQ